MYLIATDEAGYGPKLGPLIIVATAWKLPGESLNRSELAALFSGLSSPAEYGERTVTIDDSKRVFRQGDGLQSLHTVVSAGLNWCGAPQRSFPEILSYLCPDDLSAIGHTPWLAPAAPISMIGSTATKALVEHWARPGIELVDVKARVIPARDFNVACTDGFNKADLLSGSTLGLVRDLVDALPAMSPQGSVYCDRHGGRRYYAAPLQHQFPDWLLSVVGESKEESKYSLNLQGTRLDFHFTVKGDRFTPVAFSSLVAKYLRERFMESLNAYFACRFDGEQTLTPTAGYPVDADRFLHQIATIRKQEQIDDLDLVRMR